MMRALKATGFDGYLTLEVRYYDELKAGPEAIAAREAFVRLRIESG